MQNQELESLTSSISSASCEECDSDDERGTPDVLPPLPGPSSDGSRRHQDTRRDADAAPAMALDHQADNSAFAPAAQAASATSGGYAEDGDGLHRQRRRRPRTRFAPWQKARLLALYELNNSPKTSQLLQLANATKLDVHIVRIWFQNRRCNQKRWEQGRGRGADPYRPTPTVQFHDRNRHSPQSTRALAQAAGYADVNAMPPLALLRPPSYASTAPASAPRTTNTFARRASLPTPPPPALAHESWLTKSSARLHHHVSETGVHEVEVTNELYPRETSVLKNPAACYRILSDLTPEQAQGLERWARTVLGLSH
ncbi:homeobox protein prophet of Pit-1-like [Sycon ciliatum]|uniref:homeobox protein prophet of Pit-1-like n=1 Tax=Sycon ciliatum TaxID=27933 RepID=UPI0031F612C1